MFIPSTLKDTLSLHPYLTLARARFDSDTVEEQISPTELEQLSVLSLEALEIAGDGCFQLSWSQPKLSWAMMYIIDAVSQVNGADSFIRALAAWHLGRMANGWFRPDLVPGPLERAKAEFAKLGKIEWEAACNWQLCAVPWMWPDYKRSITQLQSALKILHESSISYFAPLCRLSLAYAMISNNDIELAENEIKLAKTEFIKNNYANSKFVESFIRLLTFAILRRKGNPDQAKKYSKKSLVLLEQNNAQLLCSIMQCGVAYTYFVSDGNYTQSEKIFKDAMHQFKKNDVDLWLAQCHSGLGQIYYAKGDLKQSERQLNITSKIYAQYQITSLLAADTILDLAQLDYFKGNYQRSIQKFKEAEIIYDSFGNDFFKSIAIMGQGIANTARGRLNAGLSQLESAQKFLTGSNFPNRLADCKLNIAKVWQKIGNTKLALQFLNEAIRIYKSLSVDESLTDTYIAKIQILINEKQWPTALNEIEKASSASRQLNSNFAVAQINLLTAHISIEMGFPKRALTYINQANSFFSKADMITEEAHSLILIGDCFHLLNQKEDARASWQKALQLVQSTNALASWDAISRLAMISTTDSSIDWYLRGVKELQKVRMDIIQPTLFIKFLAPVIQTLESAILTAVKKKSYEAAFVFIEESKAQTVSNLLTNPSTLSEKLSFELQEQAEEIRFLQQQRKILIEKKRYFEPEFEATNKKLDQQIKDYSNFFEQFERRQQCDRPKRNLRQFEISEFQIEAAKQLGTKWLALNVYITDEEIIFLVINARKTEIFAQPLSTKFSIALKQLLNAPEKSEFDQENLDVLGETLLPPDLYKLLSPDTLLIISPHKILHQIPWSILPHGPTQQPLIQLSLISITPSLKTLFALWHRKTPQQVTKLQGLCLSVSEFDQRHPSLPAIIQEIEQLQSIEKLNLECLTESDASLDKLEEHAIRNPLNNYNFLHIATHAFSDQKTGKLSGIALHDQDVWLNEFFQLAPLPPIVTFATCNGLRSTITTGDEHAGIFISCLLAGAETVLGSLWRIKDQAAADFFVTFYQHYVTTKSGVISLALTQRSAIYDIDKFASWSGFQAIGLPDLS